MATLNTLWGAFIRNKAFSLKVSTFLDNCRCACTDLHRLSSLLHWWCSCNEINFFFFVLLKSDVHQCFLSQPCLSWQQMNHPVNNRPCYMWVNGNYQLCRSKLYFQSTNPDLLNLHLMFSPQLSELLSDYFVLLPPELLPHVNGNHINKERFDSGCYNKAVFFFFTKLILVAW